MRVALIDVPSYVRCRQVCEASLTATRCWKFARRVEKVSDEELFAWGHKACAGCGAAIAMRLMLKATGRNTIAAQSTGCMEVVSSQYPETAWRIPWIHVAFENAAAVASGIEAALKALGKKEGVNVLAIGGDGGTVDIGLQALSGAVERGHDFTYICYDNEAYMNTGVQRSGATPYGASTTTSPPGALSIGNETPKKDMPAIMVAHRAKYVATACVSFPLDFIEKVKKAVSIKGPAYIHVLTPCPIGWGFPSEKTIEVGRLAVDTGMWALYEVENGETRITYKPNQRKPVKEYLKMQKRFKHLSEEEIEKIDQDIEERWKRLVS
ncbi:MAG: pyruvate synthase subunit beta [Candidatus Hydrothermarchaeota archaeon]|nr:MAG: pyruvate synthase subunit beta [Candidatus Hydrothermarchaeota archaeon]